MATAKRVYVDTNIVSRLVDYRITDETGQAFAALARRSDIVLVTSEKTRAEVLRTKNSKRAAVLELLVTLFKKVPFERLEQSGAIGSATISELAISGSWTDPTLVGLLMIFDSDDAEHIALAVKAGCNFFLTLDETSILSRAAGREHELATLLGHLRLVSPVQLAADLDNVEA